jgi:hypothetical protein
VAEGHGGLAFLAAFGFALLATLSKPVLNGAGVAYFFARDAGNRHDLLLSRSGRLAHRQGEQIQERIELEQLQRLGGAELEAGVRRDHQHGPVLHPGVLLQKAVDAVARS